MSKAKRPKRRDRYLAQVSNLLYYKEVSGRRKETRDTLDWAMQNLRKEDRVLWALGIVRRYHLATWDPPAGEPLPAKDLRKRKQVLKFFCLKRILRDYERLSESFFPNWSHFSSLTEVHDSRALRNMPFHHLVNGRQAPLEVKEVMDGLHDLELELVARSANRFCEQGTDFLTLPDGWKWVRVEDGFSREEARAMGHCGNQYCPSTDVMYSLREPVSVKGRTRWRPHLTFIAGWDRHFGQTKGRANAKPPSIHHRRILELFKQPRFQGIRGGGYLPQNNFSLLDLRDDQIIELADANPNFETSDPRFEHGRVLHDFGDDWDLASCALPSFRYRRARALSRLASVVVFRRALVSASRKTLLPGLAFFLDRGYLSTVPETFSPSSLPDLCQKFEIMLNLLEVRGVAHGSLFSDNCPWLAFLGNRSPEEIIAERPMFASATPVPLLLQFFGCGPHLAHALSFQHELDLRQGPDGNWHLARFRTVRRFLEVIRDYPALRLLDSLKSGLISKEESWQIKNLLLHRLRTFRFGNAEIGLFLENPASLGSACSLVVTEYGLSRMVAAIDFSEVRGPKSLLKNLVRTYDYNRELDAVAA